MEAVARGMSATRHIYALLIVARGMLRVADSTIVDFVFRYNFHKIKHCGILLK